MPGGIEPHTHLEMPFMGQEACDDFFSGQAAALAGGTTMHIDFALPLNGSIREGYHIYRKKAEKSCMDYGFHMAVTQWNDDVDKEMEYAVQQGINSFKFFMAYKGALMVNDDQLARGMYRCKELGALPMVHAENGDMVALGQEMIFAQGIHGPEGHALSRPDVLETEATGRAVRISEVVGTPLYVVHVQSKGAAEEIAAGNARGARVIGEPILPGLALDESRLWDRNWTKAAAYVMSPPIRKQSVDGAALRHALASGLLHLVGTDHAVFNSTQKAAGRHDFRKIPNGVNGIEERMHVTWELMVNSGLMSPSDFVRVTSTAAAKIFNIFPRKGVIAVGSDADVILFDPSIHHTLSAATHHSRVDMNVFEGMNITGKVITTISRGRIVWNVSHRMPRRLARACFALALSFACAGRALERATSHGTIHPATPLPPARMEPPSAALQQQPLPRLSTA